MYAQLRNMKRFAARKETEETRQSAEQEVETVRKDAEQQIAVIHKDAEQQIAAICKDAEHEIERAKQETADAGCGERKRKGNCQG